jgi:hypothetical protein
MVYVPVGGYLLVVGVSRMSRFLARMNRTVPRNVPYGTIPGTVYSSRVNSTLYCTVCTLRWTEYMYMYICIK